MKDLKVIFFNSRNKDNKHLSGFKERSHKFLIDSDDYSEIKLKYKDEFEKFVNDGLPGELSRFYILVNDINNEKLYKEFLKELVNSIDNIPNMKNIERKVISVGCKKSLSTHKGFYDFDVTDDITKDDIDKFIEDLYNEAYKSLELSHKKSNDLAKLKNDFYVLVYPSKSGYGVITKSFFKDSDLLNRWPNVERKGKDSYLLLDYKEKE